MPVFSESDEILMRRALELASRARGQTSPNPMVGAVLVKHGKVIGEGYHHGPGLDHAEIEAIRAASGPVAGAHLYVTLEPCCHHGRTPPCVDALIEHKIAKVTIAMLDPSDKVNGEGVRRLRKAGIEVDEGLCQAEARELNEAFVTYHHLKRPFVICKWAMTLDGKIATSTGHSRWITNEASRAYVHELRGQVDAVMVGVGTVLLDNPMLNVRLPEYGGRQPRRVVVDGNLRIPSRAKLLKESSPGQCIIATTESAPAEKIKQLRSAGHIVVVRPGRRGLLDVHDFMDELHQLEVQSILCEGGASLNGSLFEAQVVDKVIAFVAPKIVGGINAKSPIAGWGVDLISKAAHLVNPRTRTFGDDVCIEGYVAPLHRRLSPARKAHGKPESRSELVSGEENDPIALQETK